MASLRDERRGGIVCLLGLDRSHGTEDRADRTSSSLDLPQPQRGQRMTFRGVLYASDATDSVRTAGAECGLACRLAWLFSLALLSRFVATALPPAARNEAYLGRKPVHSSTTFS